MSMFIRDLEPSQRPRERLLEYGARSLSDAELLAVLMRTGTRGRGAVAVAHDLLAAAGGLAGVARLDHRELEARPGLGPAKAAALLAALELGQRAAKAEVRTAERLDQPQIAGEFLVRRLCHESREVFGFLSLDGRHRFLAIHELSLGTRNQAPVDAAELFRRAVLDRAAGLLLFHNHPSGDLEPSRDDLDLTRRLARGGQVVGVSVLDHILVAGGRWLSLRSARADLFAG
ncbi:MAG: DNA repair protein RadC [Thermoanaerobaculales bacterium]|nr:DNA repair protein RadC [Thermoanaerobaculales bacterium]